MILPVTTLAFENYLPLPTMDTNTARPQHDLQQLRKQLDEAIQRCVSLEGTLNFRSTENAALRQVLREELDRSLVCCPGTPTHVQNYWLIQQVACQCTDPISPRRAHNYESQYPHLRRAINTGDGTITCIFTPQPTFQSVRPQHTLNYCAANNTSNRSMARRITNRGG